MSGASATEALLVLADGTTFEGEAVGHRPEGAVATDAVTSRSPADREIGLKRMEDAGAVMSSVEMALFELLGAAGSDEFKAIQGLIK